MNSSKSPSSTTFLQLPRWAVVIAGSGGSLSPLRVLIGSLTPTLDAAYLCLVSFPPNTLGHVAAILEDASALPVRPAESGDRLRRGHVLLVSSCEPGSVRVEDAAVRLAAKAPGVRDVRASAMSSLFSSVAQCFGPSTIGIGLSGPEDDGAVAARAIKNAGGIVLVQSPLEAIHPRTPEAMLAGADADLCAGTHELAARLCELCQPTPASVAQAEAS